MARFLLTVRAQYAIGKQPWNTIKPKTFSTSWRSGHRNIKNTLVYTQLVKGREEDDYVCRVAKTVEQAAELIEAGFDYVCEINGVKLFRKRK